MQERCRQEVLEVLGDEKAAVADMPKMPYVLATIAEVGLDNKEPITFPAFFSDSKNCKGGSIFNTAHLNSVHHGHPPQLEDHLHLPQGVQLHGQHLLHHERPKALCRS